MSNYHAGGRRSGSQATSEDARTPVAWQHRDTNYQQHRDINYQQHRDVNYQQHRDVNYQQQRDVNYQQQRDVNYQQQRDVNYQQQRDVNYQQQGYTDRYRVQVYDTNHGRRGPGSISDQTSHTDRSSRSKRSPREPAPTAYRGRPAPETDGSSTTSESSRDTKVPIHDGHGGPALQLVPVNGGGPPTIRSAQSVPLLLGPAGPVTWDGEPCPVHHHHGPPPLALLPGPGPGPMSLPPPHHPGFGAPRTASLYDLRAGTPHSLYAPAEPLPPGAMTMTMDRKGGMMGPPPPPGSALGRPILPPGLMPPMMRPRPIVRAENGAPRELPVRDPRKASLVPPAEPTQQKQPVGCGGLKKVLLISLSVIVLGVILAVALIFITK